MKKVFGLFSVIFGMWGGCFFFQSCQSPNSVWCTSSGILTYNRGTGQFELMWENVNSRRDTIRDTVYIYRRTTNN